MFVRISSFGPDQYGEWKAEATGDGCKSIGFGPTEDDAIRDSRELVAMYFEIPVDEVIVEGGIKRQEVVK